MLKSFFNTISLRGKKLVEAQRNAKAQQEKVYLIFLQNKRKGMTPFDVNTEYSKLYPKVPITSIRRAMTQLTKDKHLVMTEKKRNGLYDTPNHLWELNLNNA